MGTKTIPELQLISTVTDDVNIPGDDSIQTYRVTAIKIFNYITGKLFGATAATPVAADALNFHDASDSNAIKKATVADLRNAVYRSVTTTDSVGVDDETMKLSGSSFTSTLPTAVGVTGKRYKFIHAGTSLSHIYTLATTSSQTIGGLATGVIKLSVANEALVIESDGANWVIVSHYIPSTWTQYTPTFGGTPTTANVKVFWRRVGDSMQIRGNFQITSVNSYDARISLPSGVTTDTSKVGATRLDQFGPVIRIRNSASAVANENYVAGYNSSYANNMVLSHNSASLTLSQVGWDTLFANSDYGSINCVIPITEFSLG